MSHLGMNLLDSDSESLDSEQLSFTNASPPTVNNTQASTDTTVEDESGGSVIIMASQSTDALIRTFTDLKSKSEDVRLRASYDLYGLVATASRGTLHISLQ